MEIFIQVDRLLSCHSGMDAWDRVDAYSSTESYVSLVSATRQQRMQRYHFQRIQKKHPQSGTILSETPGLLISSFQGLVIMGDELEV